MIQSNLAERNCINHPQNKVILICQNKYCQQSKLICCSCLVDHLAHVENLLDQKKFEEQILFTQQESQSFVSQINKLFEQVLRELDILKQGILEKFSITINQANSFDNEQLNEYLSQAISFEKQSEVITELIKNGCQDFQQKLQNCIKILNVEQISYKKLNEKDLQKAEDLYNQGYEQYLNNNYQKAIELFKKTLEINRNHDKSFYYLGLINWQTLGCCLYNLTQYEESLEWYDRAIQVNPINKLALHGKAESLRILQQYQNSIELYNIVIQIDPNFKCGLFGKGEALRNLNKYEESLEFYDRVLQIDPKYKACLQSKGEVLKVIKRYSEAIQYFERILEIDPNNKSAMFKIGESLLGMKKYQESIIWYDKTLKIAPKDILALCKKCESLKEMKNFSQALEVIEQALIIDQTHELAMNYKGLILIMQNKFSEAKLQLDKAIKLYCYLKQKIQQAQQ